MKTRTELMAELGETIRQACDAGGPMGAPGGILYAAMMQYGITLEQFYMLMSYCVHAGLVRLDGECYHAIPKRENLAPKVLEALAVMDSFRVVYGRV